MLLSISIIWLHCSTVGRVQQFKIFNFNFQGFRLNLCPSNSSSSTIMDPMSPVDLATQEDPNVQCQKEEQEQKGWEPASQTKDEDTEDYFELSSSGRVMTFIRHVSSAQQLADLIQGIGSPARQLVTTLNFEFDYNEKVAKLDLDLNLNLLLPALERLHLRYIAWCNFNLKSTSLLNIEIENPIPECCGKFAFRFPNLVSFNSTFLYLEDSSDFAASLSASPKLKRLCCYKLWGLGNQSTWYLPSCEDINLYRSDDLSKPKLYCPRLQELNLRACYDISSVTLLKR